MTHKKVAVLITVYNRLEPLRECLQSLQTNDPSLFDIYLIDNGSRENVEDVAREFKTKYLRLPNNKFVSYALNAGFNHFSIQKKYPYTILMGSDVWVDKNMINVLAAHMDNHPTVGVSGPSHYQISSRKLLSIGISINPITSLLINSTSPTDKKRINHFHSLYIVRSDAFKMVGGFDDVLFPMIYEEPDLGERILKKNYTISPCPQATIRHPIETKEARNNRVDNKKERLHNTSAKAYLFFRNRIIYMSLYSSRIQFLFFYIVFNPIIILAYLRDLPKENYRYLWLGIRDGSRFAITKNKKHIQACNSQVLGI